MNMNSLKFLLTTLLVLIYSKNFAQTNYYKMKNGKILTEEQYSTVKQNALKNGKVEGIILKREIKNDSIINTARITILMRDDKNNYFFITAGDGLSAKCPPGLFDDKVKLENDCQVLFEKILKFTK